MDSRRSSGLQAGVHVTATQSNRGKLKSSPIAKLAHEKREREKQERIAAVAAAIAADQGRATLKNGRIAQARQKLALEDAARALATDATAQDKRRMGDMLLTEGRQSRTVKKYLTTLDQLEKRGQLPKELRVAFDQFAKAVSDSTGACTDERDHRNGSSRGIAALESAAGGGFGPRSVSDATLRAQRLSQYVWGIIPEGMMRLARHLIEEETAYTMLKPPPLTDYGNANGFNQEQQARSSGATMAIDLCRVIHHALKSR